MKLNASAPDYANLKGGNLCIVRNKHKHRHYCTLDDCERVILEVKAKETKCLLALRQQ